MPMFGNFRLFIIPYFSHFEQGYFAPTVNFLLTEGNIFSYCVKCLSFPLTKRALWTIIHTEYVGIRDKHSEFSRGNLGDRCAVLLWNFLPADRGMSKSTEVKCMAGGIFDIFDRIAKERAPEQREPITYLIVGLGNPGQKYENTRHNTGFMAADYIASKVGASINQAKFKGLCGEASFRIEYEIKPKKGKKHRGETDEAAQEETAPTPRIETKCVRALILKPQTLMNRSGISVSEAADFYKIPPERIIVIYDDISLDVGKMRVRRKGSAGGHNGIKSINEFLGSENFPRIKMGVGQKPHPDYDLADWVLGAFSKNDIETLKAIFPTMYEGLLQMLVGDIDGAMQVCN